MTSSVVSEAKRQLTTPWGVFVMIPLLVAATGIGIAWIGHLRLSRLATELATTRMHDAASGLNRAAISMLAGIDPLLDRWRTNVHRLQRGDQSGGQRETWENMLTDLMAGEPSVSWISWSNIDGRFHGMRRDPELGLVQVEYGDQDDSREGEWRRDEAGRPQHINAGDPSFDPRQQPGWKAAVTATKRSWTDSFRLHTLGEHGISRVEPLYDDDGKLLGVIGVDFNLKRLVTRMRAAADDIDAELLLFDQRGAILADTERQSPIGRGALPQLDKDPRRTLIDAALASPNSISITNGNDGRIAVVRELAAAPGLTLRLAFIAPLAPLLAPAQEQFLNGLRITFLVILAAVVVAALYARQLVQSRREVLRARRAADKLGAYILEGRIGIGGMGEVWRAHHRRLACPAALKVIRPNGFTERNPEHMRQRFEREAQAMASLTSPFTVRVFDFGQLDDGSLYYAMELLDGLDCESLVIKRGPLSPGAVVHILLQACDALGEAHRKGLVHRDLKPANILICRAGSRANLVKVVDFGLVAAIRSVKTDPDRLTRDGFIAGTPGFCSPEQIRGETLDGRSDLYALGCVAHWLVTGHMVFTADEVIEELRLHLLEPPPHLGDRIPVGLAKTIRMLLAKRPEDRPRDAATLREMLLAGDVDPDGSAVDLAEDERQPIIPTSASEAHEVRPVRSSDHSSESTL